MPTLYEHGLIILTPDLTADYTFMTSICHGLYLAAQSELKNDKNLRTVKENWRVATSHHFDERGSKVAGDYIIIISTNQFIYLITIWLVFPWIVYMRLLAPTVHCT